MEKFVAEDIIAMVDRIVAYSPTELVFFAYWAWWEALGKPNDYLGEKMLVLCPQDNKWHTPQEIKKKGWDRDVKDCPLHSDDEVTEYYVEGPCADEMENRCPIAERSEDD